MNGIVCGTCGHVVLNGAAPETCPVCASPKEVFKEEAAAVKTFADPDNPQDAEKKHTPDIVVVKDCGLIPDVCQDAHARVGIDILHPMEDDHYITWLDFYVNKDFITRVILTPACQPGGGIHLKSEATGTLTVIENCNLHGKWINEKEL